MGNREISENSAAEACLFFQSQRDCVNCEADIPAKGRARCPHRAASRLTIEPARWVSAEARLRKHVAGNSIDTSSARVRPTIQLTRAARVNGNMKQQRHRSVERFLIPLLCEGYSPYSR
jgi:hypothetical protein